MHFLQSDLERAKELLKEKHYTCVLCKDAQCVTSKEHGVKPLLAFLNSGESYADFSAADQIVGQAAAHLYLLIGVSAVYADVISKGAIQLLTEHHIPVEHGTVVDQIRNRAGNDICPMEKAVTGIIDSQLAVQKIQETILTLKKPTQYDFSDDDSKKCACPNEGKHIFFNHTFCFCSSFL